MNPQQPAHPLPFQTATIRPLCPTLLQKRPELGIFLVLILLLNIPILAGSCSRSLIFSPEAVAHGQWWRLLTHPFVHLTWYHLLLDGTAFLSLYASLIEPHLFRRLAYVAAAAAGSLLVSWASAAPSLCGLSGIAHGLMAISALEMIQGQPLCSAERRIGWLTFVLVLLKAAFEALTGTMFLSFLDFGLLGSPVAVSHAGGIMGSLCALLLVSMSQIPLRGVQTRPAYGLREAFGLRQSSAGLASNGRSAAEISCRSEKS